MIHKTQHLLIFGRSSFGVIRHKDIMNTHGSMDTISKVIMIGKDKYLQWFWCIELEINCIKYLFWGEKRADNINNISRAELLEIIKKNYKMGIESERR